MERKKTAILRFNETAQSIEETEAQLELVSGPASPKTFTLHPKTTVGAVEGDIVIDDEYLSRRHFEIRLEPAPTIVDLDSTNGTFVNGVRIEKAALDNGYTITAGKCSFRFTIKTAREKLEPSKSTSFLGIVSQAPSMRRIFALIERVAPTDIAILLVGETGTGKELVARAIHRLSTRSGAFIPVNCGAITRELVESELFGHEKGAFTGADRARAGLFELADNGTIMLDEVADLPAELQSRLLRTIETGEVRRVGSTRYKNVNARVIAATNRELKGEVAAKRFREDLFFRLTAVTVHIPPLRERKEDIPLLAEHFIAEIAKKSNLPTKTLSPDTLRELEDYDWPGNVRELKNAVERAFILSEQHAIGPSDLQFAAEAQRAKELPSLNIKELEVVAIREALARAGGIKRRAAMLLGISPSTLDEKMKRYGIEHERKRD